MEQLMRRRWSWLIGVLVIASMSLSSAAPLGAKSAAVPQGPQPGVCRLADQPVQPQEPLELNTIARDGLFKTVAMEKEVFICNNQAGAPMIIRDVETFIEIVQRDKGVIVEQRVEIATCNKDFETGNVSCGTKSLPLTNVEQPLKGCNPQTLAQLQPRDPVEMNTVTTIGTDGKEYVKTIKVEKEILACDAANGASIGDNYLFTEIIEMRGNIAGTHNQTYRPVLRQFLGFLCRKDVAKGTIVACRPYRPLPLPAAG